MGKELEVKVLNINVNEMEKKLISVGAKLVKKERQENIIFDTRNIFSKQGIEGYMRIRETNNLLHEGKSYALTLKKRKYSKNLRKNIEIETQIENKDTLIEIFHELGIDIVHRGHKLRTSYAYENLLFELDIWDKETYPEPYMEIEMEKESDLEKAIKLRDLNREDITNKSLGILRNKYFLKDSVESKGDTNK